MPLARFSWLIAVVCCFATFAQAEENAPQLSEELRGLIQQLDADAFGERQAASQQLAKLGKQAIPALEEAIRGESVEAASRSFELLQRLLTKGDNDAQAEARAALERLAKGDDAAARRAQQLLKPTTPEDVPQTPAARPRIRLGGGAPIRIPVAPAVAVRRSVKVNINNGLKTIEVDDNGKRIKILDDPAKGIELETTETKDGKETTEKFAAKNAEELKIKHPEAFKLYNEFAQGGPNQIRVQIGGAPNREALQGVLKESVKRLDERIDKLKNDPALPAEIRQKHIEALERHRDRLKDSIKEAEQAK
jgi:hypothetical protein